MGHVSDGSGPVAATAGVPLHRQLFLVLHDEIARGALRPGDPLPTEQSLGEQFGVSRITVRRALADLAEQGYIERRHGVGSFVRQRDPGREAASGGTYLDELRQVQFETDVDVVELGVEAVPPAIGARLGCDGDMLHVLRVRRERRTREPLMVTDAWLPAGLAGVVTAEALADAALYDLLADAGVVIERMDHEFTAEVAGPRAAWLLDTAIGSALLRVNRVAHADGHAHHYLSITLSPNRSRVLISQPGENFTIAHDVRRRD
jgi:GntR family transcriptional regulator